MIITGPIVFACLLALVSLLLGAGAVLLALRVAISDGLASGGEASDRLQQKAQLVLFVLSVALGLRIVAWPSFYLALSSAVPHVAGAMCIFGVTRLYPLPSNLIQAIQPLLLFTLGGWAALHIGYSELESRTPGPLRPRTVGEKVLFVLGIVLLLLEAGLELGLLVSLEPDRPVYCCGSVYDLPGRLTTVLPARLLDERPAGALLPAMIVTIGAQALTALLLGWRRVRGGGRTDPRGRPLRMVAAAWLLLLSAAALGVTTTACAEVITPRVTGLPYHHCLYCLLGRTVWGPPLAVLLGAGMLLSWWGALLLPGPKADRIVPGNGSRGECDRLLATWARAAGRGLVASGVLLALFLLAATFAVRLSQGGSGDLGSCLGCGRVLGDSVHLVELVTASGSGGRFCSPECALRWMRDEENGERAPRYVTVRDEFTGVRLDAEAAYFVESAASIPGLPEGNRIHVYQYFENAHIMAFELDGVVMENPFAVADSDRLGDAGVDGGFEAQRTTADDHPP